jgi:hypothetical protein
MDARSIKKGHSHSDAHHAKHTFF